MEGLATVFGGSGFVGRYVVRALARRGWRIRVAVRHPNIVPELRVMGDVGQIELVQANVRNADSVARALVGAQACVNLVGVLFERGRQAFDSLHAAAPQLLAEQAARAGADRFVHISAIGADATSPAAYGRSKAQGEAGVRGAFPRATILRPSIVFGPEDDFFNRFGAMAAIAPALPLIGGGRTRFQPVYAGDVGQAVVRALDQPAASGTLYELGGPGVYDFRELMQVVLKETLRRRALVPIPFSLARLIGRAGEIQGMVLPFAPTLTRDQVELLRSDNVVDPDQPGLDALGVAPTPLEAILPTYMWRFRRGGQFAQPDTANARGAD